MSAQDEATWQRALERKGRDWVIRELQLRAGQPHDYLLDVVYEEPHPTREFCHRWCVEQENKMGRPSPGTMLVVLILVIVMIAGVMFGSRDWGRAQHVQTTTNTR